MSKLILAMDVKINPRNGKKKIKGKSKLFLAMDVKINPCYECQN